MAIRTSFSKKEHGDSGLALLLAILISGLILKVSLAMYFAIAIIVVLLIAPVLIFPFTFLWLNISDFLGRITSKLLLIAIFLVLVCPVAFVRKVMGKDTLSLRKYKRDKNSVFISRNHTYTKIDLTTPY